MKDPKITRNDVSLRDLAEGDVPLLMDYWYRSPPGYVEAMGVDPTKLEPEETMRKRLIERARSMKDQPQSKSPALCVLYQGEPIGVHVVNPVTEGESAVFHAHFWKRDLRGKGIGTVSYALASRLFMERFNLKEIYFKTPAQNTASIRVKEKLGIPYLGEEVIELGLVRAGTRAKVFRLRREELVSLPIFSLSVSS